MIINVGRSYILYFIIIALITTLNASVECYQSKTFIDGSLTKDYINYLISVDVKTPKQKGKEAQDLKEDLSSDFQEKFKEKIEDFGLCYMQDRSTDFSDYANQIKKFVKYIFAAFTVVNFTVPAKKRKVSSI